MAGCCTSLLVLGNKIEILGASLPFSISPSDSSQMSEELKSVKCGSSGFENMIQEFLVRILSIRKALAFTK